MKIEIEIREGGFLLLQGNWEGTKILQLSQGGIYRVNLINQNCGLCLTENDRRLTNEDSD